MGASEYRPPGQRQARDPGADDEEVEEMGVEAHVGDYVPHEDDGDQRDLSPLGSGRRGIEDRGDLGGAALHAEI